MKNIKINHSTFILSLIIISVFGFLLRWSGIRFEGVDYQACLSVWYEQLKSGGGLSALVNFEGDYNLPYVTALLLLTYLPLKPIISIKLLSIFFDYVGAFAIMALLMDCVEESKKRLVGAISFLVVLCLPTAVVNSGYLAQSDGIWASLAILSFYLITRNKPVRGMLILGCALGMKLQAVFILPIILIYYFKRKSFSILHLLWIPVAIQLLSMPAVIAGCGWDVALRVFNRMLGRYPFLYYYYPNIWTYFQEAPYYVFGTAAIGITFIILLLFAVLVIKSKREHTLSHYFEYTVWTSMTCAMFLPCMHERYNFLAEILIVGYAIIRPKYRIPALLLSLVSLQCYAQYFLGWYYVSPYVLALCNIGIYVCITAWCVGSLYQACFQKDGKLCLE